MLLSFFKSLSGSPPFGIMSKLHLLLFQKVCNLIMSHSDLTYFIDSPLVRGWRPALSAWVPGSPVAWPCLPSGYIPPHFSAVATISWTHHALPSLQPLFKLVPPPEITLPLPFLLPRSALLQDSCGISHLGIVLNYGCWFIRSGMGLHVPYF